MEDDDDDDAEKTFNDSTLNENGKRALVESNEPTPEPTAFKSNKNSELGNSEADLRIKKNKQAVSTYLLRRSVKYNKKLPFLERLYVKISPSEVISLCNDFEIPSDVAYQLLDYFIANSTYLTRPWQLVCGLILHSAFVIYHEKRHKDPRIDHHLVDRMANAMNCSSTDDIFNCYKIVEELVIGEKWFRNLQIKYNYFDMFSYQELMSIRLGSMLQNNSVLLSDEQYSNWKRRVLQDLSLR